MLWPHSDLRPLRYYYCDVSGSNWFDLYQFSWPELVRSTGGACIKVWNSFLIWILRTGPHPILEPSAELNPACISFWRRPKKCLHLLPTVFLRNFTERVDPPLPFVLETYPKVSPATTEEPTRLLWRGGFFFHNKTWTIIPTLGSLRVYVHPWSSTVSLRFLPCSRYPNSRKCVHTPQTDLTRNPFSRTNTTPTHT